MGKDSARDTESLQASAAKPLDQIDLSVCIVTYQARSMLRNCLTSLYENTDLNFETIVVDNGSTDGTTDMLIQEFPDVLRLRNEHNEGYTRPMNQALDIARGCYLLQLNPDTLILPQSLDTMVTFMEACPEAGICGPKVLNSDGTLQKPCRRGESTPWAVFTYFSGLYKLFPKSKLLGQYLMTYMGEDETHLVDGVSGSCMLIRKEVIDQIGNLDERFFAYQEDADLCFRARNKGWLVYYYPESQIIHFGGLGGSHVQPYRSIFEWHRSYYLYYRKNLANNYIFLLNWAYYFAMVLKYISAVLINFFRKDKFVGTRRP